MKAVGYVRVSRASQAEKGFGLPVQKQAIRRWAKAGGHRIGRRLKAEKGGYAFGAPRYGTRSDEGTLVEEPREAEIVRRVAELRRAGTSLRGICNVLDTEGFKPRRGSRWHPAVVARIASRGGVPTARASVVKELP